MVRTNQYYVESHSSGTIQHPWHSKYAIPQCRDRYVTYINSKYFLFHKLDSHDWIILTSRRCIKDALDDACSLVISVSTRHKSVLNLEVATWLVRWLSSVSPRVRRSTSWTEIHYFMGRINNFLQDKINSNTVKWWFL